MSFINSLPRKLRIELSLYNDYNNLIACNDYRSRFNCMPESKYIVFRKHTLYYNFYFWPSVHVQYVPFVITGDMTNEELKYRVCRAFDQDVKSNITVYEYNYIPKDPEFMTRVRDYMPEVHDISQYIHDTA